MSDNSRDGSIGVGLADAIKGVRAELQSAIMEGHSSPLAFTVGPIQLDFEVAFAKSAEGNAGVQVYVVSIGAKGSLASTTTHRLTVSLVPVDRSTGEKIKVRDVGTK